MALDRIEAWLRLRDTARFNKDAKSAARHIRDIGDAADDSEKNVSGLTEGFSGFDSVGSTAATTLTMLGTRTLLLGGGLLAALPLIISVGGALVALAGSATLALGGLAALGLALGGVLLVGLSGIAFVVKGLATGFDKIKKAQDAYALAVASFGKDSKQAATALDKLNGTIKLFGGSNMVKAIAMTRHIGDEFRKRTNPAMRSAAGVFLSVMTAADRLLPVFGKVTNMAAKALGGPLRSAVRQLSGPDMRGSILALGKNFASLASPLVHTAADLIMGMARMAVQAAPFLRSFAESIADAAHSFAIWAGSKGAGSFIERMVDNFRSWWGLLKAVGGLLGTVLGGGAKEGQSLVDSLTGVVNKMNAWLQAGGKEGMISFFKEAVSVTKWLAGVLGAVIVVAFKLGRAMIPAAQAVWNFVKPLAPFFQNILIPLALGFAKGFLGAFSVIIPILGLVIRALGWLGKQAAPIKGWFEKIGLVLGLVFGPAILRAVGALSKVSGVMKGVSFIARALMVPINLIGGAFLRVAGFALRIGRSVLLAIPLVRAGFNRLLGFAVGLASRFWTVGTTLGGKIVGGIASIFRGGLALVKDLGKIIGNAVIAVLNGAINAVKITILGKHIDPFPDNPIPQLAGGGLIGAGGSAIVGERGPEIAQQTALGTRITPLAVSTGTHSTVLTGGDKTIHVPVYLKGKVIADVVASEAETAKARQ